MAVCAHGFFPHQAVNFWKVEADHCVQLWMSQCQAQRQEAEDLGLGSVLPLGAGVSHLLREKPRLSTGPSNSVSKLKMVADFCYGLHLQEDPMMGKRRTSPDPEGMMPGEMRSLGYRYSSPQGEPSDLHTSAQEAAAVLLPFLQVRKWLREVK